MSGAHLATRKIPSGDPTDTVKNGLNPKDYLSFDEVDNNFINLKNQDIITGYTNEEQELRLRKVSGVEINLGKTSDLIDLNYSTLVTPVINTSWKIYNNSDVFQYDSTGNSLTLENGFKARILSKYTNPAPSEGYSSPTSVSGSWGTSLVSVGSQSDNVLGSDIDGYSVIKLSTNASYNVTFYKPKSGLIVVNNQVQYATGNDSTTASCSLSFSSRNYYGYLVSRDISESDIEAGTTSLSNGKSKTISGVQTNYSASRYFFYAYPANLGNLSTLIVNGANSFNLAAGEAMSKETLTITNAAGISVLLNVYLTKDNNAFSTSSTLAFS